jgi:hypothetical protein
MKTFLAIYIGTEAALEKSGWNQMEEGKRKEKSAAGFKAWIDWGTANAGSIVEYGAPLGKTKRIAPDGIADIKNVMTGYVVVRAETHEAAAKLFENHPHFSIFPGDSVELMECLPMPKE